jgi:two-component system, NtrC family, sensor histidine kinase HydH
MSARSQRHEADAASLNLAPALASALSPGILVISRREQILACNREAEQLLDLQPSVGAHAPLSLLPAPLQNLVHEVLASGRPVSADRLHLFAGKAAGQFHVNALPLPARPDSLEVLLILSEVTGFFQFQQSAARLNRLATIGTLAASMAHELKNALVPVKTFVDLLLEKNKDSELADVVAHEMNRMNNIVRQMLKFGSPGTPTRALVRLHDVLDHSLRMVQHQLDGKLISLNRAFNAQPDAVHGDNHQLEQVFVNLLLNAVEATGPNGSLTVATELVTQLPPHLTSQPAARPHIRVVVADTGIGIAPENLDRMFEPFFTTKRLGTGLGLPISQRIVHEHDGHISVQSEPNKGTTFSILLPADGKAL